MDDDTTQRRQGERRRLWDRRASEERRSGEDRRHEDRDAAKKAVATERRKGKERRSGEHPQPKAADRRSPKSRRRRERRSTTPVPYSPEQHAELRARFASPGPVTCPVCGGRFTLGPARREGDKVERLVLCMGCRRGTVVDDASAARVLVVSGEAPLRKLLYDMLSGAGHEVVEADDAVVGLEAYRAIPADLVIVDVLATGRLGATEFLRRLRQTHPDARVAALAGRSSHADIDPLQLVGSTPGVRGLRVPVSREELLKLVQELRG